MPSLPRPCIMAAVTEPSLEATSLSKTTETESELTGTHNPIPGVASTRFHQVLMLSIKLSHVNNVVLALYLAGFGLLVYFVWALASESTAVGLAVSVAFLTLSGIDWLMLAQLPRHRRSFGPVRRLL